MLVSDPGISDCFGFIIASNFKTLSLKSLVLLNSTAEATRNETAIRACDAPILCSVVGDHDLLSRIGLTTRSQKGTRTRIVTVAKTDTEAGGISNLELPTVLFIESACWTMIVASWA